MRKFVVPTNKSPIVCSSIERYIPHIEDSSIQLVLTSPPYNVDLGNNKYNKNPYDLYKDNKEHSEYLSWLRDIFYELYPKLCRGGRVVINVGDGKNGAVPTSSDIIQFMCHDIGYLPLTHIIWNKNQVSNRAAWGSFCSPSSPSFPMTFEHILVFCKDSKKLYSNNTVSDLTKEEFIKYTNPLWTFSPEKKMKMFGHPAMFPEELAERCIKMFTYVGDKVLDPFNGAGTTTYVAHKLNRSYIGVDISPEYCKLAKERIKQCQKDLIKTK